MARDFPGTMFSLRTLGYKGTGNTQQEYYYFGKLY